MPGLRQAAITISAALVGAVPGVVLWLAADYPVGFGIVLSLLGGFIAGTLTLPGVSAKRVLGHTAGAIVSHNVGRTIGDGVTSAITGEGEDDPQRPKQAAPNFDFLKDLQARRGGTRTAAGSFRPSGP